MQNGRIRYNNVKQTWNYDVSFVICSRFIFVRKMGLLFLAQKSVRLNWKGGFWWFLFINEAGVILVFTTLIFGKSATNIAGQNVCSRTTIWLKLRFSFWPNSSFSHHACNWLGCVHFDGRTGQEFCSRFGHLPMTSIIARKTLRHKPLRSEEAFFNKKIDDFPLILACWWEER